jgi:hypothetical protein
MQTRAQARLHLTAASFGDACPTRTAYCNAVRDKQRTASVGDAAVLERELGVFGFQAYFRLLHEVLGDDLSQEVFVDVTQDLAALWGAEFVWENAFQETEDKYKTAAAWALALFDEMSADWSYCEKCEWWEADKSIFERRYGAALG